MTYPTETREPLGAAKLIYILYLVGFAAPPVALGGLIYAYSQRGEAGPVERSHLIFQIRSFWWGLLALVVGGALSIVLIGWAVVALWTIWALARFVTGLIAASEGRAVQDPEGFGFSA